MTDHKNTTIQEIPKGFCQCGCGGKTRVPQYNDTTHGYTRGEPVRYIKGHHSKTKGMKFEGKKGPESNNWKGGRHIDSFGYVRIYKPDHPRANQGSVAEHILKIETALGKPLPPGAVSHHADGNKKNNENSNLVACQGDAYHLFLHQRTRAYKACGHASWRKCRYCKKYDDPMNVTVDSTNHVYHKECKNIYQRARTKNRKEEK